jgi:hypothetical protein
LINIAIVSDLVILSSGLKYSFFAIKSLSINTSTFLHAQVFGLVSVKSLNSLSHLPFFGNQATHLATAAISCLRTLSDKL